MARPKITPKSAETRERILRSASQLFVQEGFRQATMRRIAEDAGVALGLTYRYFPAKEDLALALYGELAVQLAASSERWGEATLADGFRQAVSEKLELAGSHRELLAALFAASLGGDPDAHAASIVGPRSAAVRTQVRWVFQRVVERATDLPSPLDEKVRADLATVLYGLHLVVLLAWLVQRSDGPATQAMLDAVGTAMRQATPFVASPAVRPVLQRTARWFGQFLGDRPPSSPGRHS
jgi:AcrR family transcriptional regulator